MVMVASNTSQMSTEPDANEDTNSALDLRYHESDYTVIYTVSAIKIFK